MRGPEYEYTCTHTKILHIGASFAFGFGVNENETYPHYLSRLTHGCYWNVSPVNTILEVVDILEDLINKLNPSAVIITTPRFVQDFDFLKYPRSLKHGGIFNDVSWWEEERQRRKPGARPTAALG